MSIGAEGPRFIPKAFGRWGRTEKQKVTLILKGVAFFVCIQFEYKLVLKPPTSFSLYLFYIPILLS